MAVQRSEEILISIVVPVYKIEETYLYECLNSLKNQTLKEISVGISYKELLLLAN